MNAENIIYPSKECLTECFLRGILVTVIATMYICQSFGQNFNEWKDLEVNSLNRLPMHAPLFPFMTEKEALQNQKESSSNYISLNGNWKFNWVEKVDDRPQDFYRKDYNDRGWTTMTVPGLWELNGYGDPVYVNWNYAWKGNFRNDPPNVPEEGNHVGSYRKTVTIPKDWKNKKVIANFGSVTSNIYLWVNGEFVGYSEDSKLEAEFDITKYIHPGENLIAFQVFRWCDGTYLEDQDFFRFSGVGRDCFLYAVDKGRNLRDIRVIGDLSSDYKNGELEVKVWRTGSFPVDLKLLDPEGKIVMETTIAKDKDEIRESIPSVLT